MSEMTAGAARPDMPDQESLPPVTEVAVASMILIVIGGIYMASHLPHHAPVMLPIIVLVGSAALIGWNALSLSRVRDFSWSTFWLVGRWAVIAYIVIAGMLLYVFLKDGTRGSQLILVMLMLITYAINVPLLLAFGTARYQPPDR
jgi:hypothetical protein